MSRLFTEPFDAKDLLPFQKPVGSFGTTADVMDFPAYLQTPAFNARTGYTYSANQSENFWGFFFNPNGMNESQKIFLIRKVDQPLYEVRYNAVGRFEIWKHTTAFESGAVFVDVGTNVRSNGLPMHVQIRFKNDAAGALEVKIDDNDDVGISQDTRGPAAGYPTFDNFQFVGISGNATYFIDSLYVNDTSGIEDNTWGGIVRMKSFVPISDGFWTQWSKSSGTDGFAMVDDTPHDFDVTRVFSNTDGQKISYNPPPHGLVSPAVIQAIMGRHIVRKVTAGAVTPFFRVNSTDYPMAGPQGLGVAYLVVMDRRTKNPDTNLPWALTDAFEVGLESNI